MNDSEYPKGPPAPKPDAVPVWARPECIEAARYALREHGWLIGVEDYHVVRAALRAAHDAATTPTSSGELR